jgi:uncharacterized protein (DUF433 family)
MAGGFVLWYCLGMTSEVFPRITIDPNVCFGKPCIRGMRIRVTDVLDMLAGGATRAQILEDFPYLEDADITAALSYAARAADNKIAFAAE